MKTIILLTLSVITSCCGPYKTEEEILSEMKSPVKVIGISLVKEGINAHHFVTVIDSCGAVITFTGALGLTLAESNKVNDTIK